MAPQANPEREMSGVPRPGPVVLSHKRIGLRDCRDRELLRPRPIMLGNGATDRRRSQAPETGSDHSRFSRFEMICQLHWILLPDARYYAPKIATPAIH